MEPSVPIANVPAGGPPGRLRPPTPRVGLVLVASLVVGLVVLAAAASVKPFLLGVVLIYLLAPAVDALAARRVPRALAVILVFAATIIVVVVVAIFALTPLVQQVRLFVDDLPTLLSDLRVALDRFYGDLRLPREIRDLVDGLLLGAGAGLGALDVGGIVAPLVNSLISLVSTVTAYAILPAWMFFLLKDRVRLADALERSLPPSWRGDVFAVGAITSRVFGNWIRGQIFLGTVVGVASFIGLMALSVLVDPVFARYAVLLAIIAGVLELVPFIGPIIAAIPAVLVGLSVGPGPFLAALLLYLAIQQLENQVLVPKIQGDAVELHPSAVMFALVVGAALGGILGAIVSLPIAAAGRDVFRFLFRRLSEPPATVEEALAGVSPRLARNVRVSALSPQAPAPAAVSSGPTGEGDVTASDSDPASPPLDPLRPVTKDEM